MSLFYLCWPIKILGFFWQFCQFFAELSLARLFMLIAAQHSKVSNFQRHVKSDHVDIFVVTPRHFGGGEKKIKIPTLDLGNGTWEGVLPDPYIISDMAN